MKWIRKHFEPDYAKVIFENVPGLARVNTPAPDFDQRRRTVRLPNGETYIIPERQRGHFVMLYDWPIRIQIDDQKISFSVPKNTTTYFASVPRVLHNLLSPLNNTIYASILHDYLYRNPLDPVVRAITRADADRIFYWGMRSVGVWFVTAFLMYLGVVIGGRKSYIRRPPRARQ